MHSASLRRSLAAAAWVGVVGCSGSFLHDIHDREAPTDRTCAPDAGVTGVAAEVTVEGVTLSWQTAATNHDGVVLYRGDNGGPLGRLTTVAAGEIRYTDTTVALGGVYTYELATYRTVEGQECETAHAPPVVAVAAPAPLTLLVFAHPSSVALDLHLQDLENHATTGYRLERRLASEASFTLLAASLAPTAATPGETVFLDAGLTPRVDYVYRVTVLNPSGESEPREATVFTGEPPVLAWGGPPQLGGGCRLEISGVASFDTAADPDAVYAGAAGSAVSGCGDLVADDHGLSCTLTDLTQTSLSTAWVVTDDRGASTTLTRELALTRTDDAPRSPADRPTGADPGFTGRQALWPSCGACTGAPGSIAVGDVHTCVLTTGGTAACWGAHNDEGWDVPARLGNGSPDEALNPLLVCAGAEGAPCAAPLAGASAVARGDRHACAIVAGGAVKCWGNNLWGQLGDGSFAPRGTPADVCVAGAGAGCTALTGATALALGAAHSCALLSTGEVRCWGSNGEGEAGAGHGGPPWLVNAAPVCASGAEVSGDCVPLGGVTALAAGGVTSCARLTTGELRCWGRGGDGERGDGSCGSCGRTEVNPAPVAGDAAHSTPLAGIAQLAGGATHRCAVDAAGVARCWGVDDSGELGAGVIGDHSAPLPVCRPGVAGASCLPLGEVRQVVAGEDHSCAIAGAADTVYCWGSNWSAALGDGDLDLVGNSPWARPVCASGSTAAGTCVPLTGAIGLALGTSHSCALLAAGELWCWGSNSYGQLGVGITSAPFDEAANPLPVCAPGAVFDGSRCDDAGASAPLSGVTALAAAGYFTCAVVGSGPVPAGTYCWGDNDYGQLGSDTASWEEPAPVPVCDWQAGACSGAPLGGVTQLSANLYHACARLDDGTARCWGWNGEGELGDGTTTTRLTPVPVCATGAWDGVACAGGAPLAGVAALAAGFSHTCALLAGGEVRCFGDNSDGALGLGVDGGSVGQAENPAVVCATGAGGTCVALGGVAELAAGEGYTCARLTAGGAVVCWGTDDTEQALGWSGLPAEPTPQRVCVVGTGLGCVPLTGVVTVAVGDGHGCATDLAGELWCWGRGGYGQLGTGVELDEANPAGVCAVGTWDGSACTGAPGAARLGDVRLLAAGGLTTCATTSAAGALWCWGRGGYGTLGNCDTSDASVPAPVGADASCAAQLASVGALSLAADHGCASLTGAGEVRCWGANGDAALALGEHLSPDDEVLHATAACLTGAAGTASCAPLVGSTALGVGSGGGCAVLGGEVRCWGDNAYGVLGVGGGYFIDASPGPVCASGYGASCVPQDGLRSLAAAGDFSCAVTDAGRVRCWGSNSWGQRGGGWEGFYNLPSAVHPNEVCAAGQWDGSACLDGATPSPLTGVVAVATGGDAWAVYVDLVGGSELGQHACALLDDGTVRCWGSNLFGQLGNGQSDPDPYSFPDLVELNPVQVICPNTTAPGCAATALGEVVALAAGALHTCALLADGHVKCWGDNSENQLGDGTDVAQATATDVRLNGSDALLDDAVALAAGWTHTCALRRDTTVACWGYNEDGELGTGDWGGGGAFPATVCAAGTGIGCSPLTGVVALAAGTWNTCALLGDGTVRCWGWAAFGESGSGSYGPATAGLYGYANLNPVAVCAPRVEDSCDERVPCTGLLGDIVALDVGWRHSCALAAGGDVYCWGAADPDFDFGQRGDGDVAASTERCTPTLVCNVAAGNCGETRGFGDGQVMTCDIATVTVP